MRLIIRKAVAALILLLPLYLSGVVIEVPGSDADGVSRNIRNHLQKLKSDPKENPETGGFTHRLDSRFADPFTYSIWIGSFNGTTTTIRVESSRRMAGPLAASLSKELKPDWTGQGYRPIKGRSTLLGSTAVLLHPGLGYFYANYDSPFAPKNIWLNTTIYSGVDLILYWFGSTTFFTHESDPFGSGLIATLILMGGHRLFHLYPLVMQISAENRMASVGYSYRF